MNSISKSHQRYSRLLNSRILEFPEEFLGPNYEEVLNFWMFLDDLSQEQLRVVNERYLAFYDKNPSEWRKAIDLAIKASREVVGWDYANEAGWAAYNVTNSYAVYFVTEELIGMHLILDQEKPLTFFEMILDHLNYKMS